MSFFSQQDAFATQAAFDTALGVGETQLGSQVDWSFLDFGTQPNDAFSDFKVREVARCLGLGFCVRSLRPNKGCWAEGRPRERRLEGGR